MVELSLIIPCYNEMQVIENSLKEIKEVLDKSRYSYEVILIDDGSKDGTREIGYKLTSIYGFKWYENDKNIGRGGTVTRGIKLAKGKFAGFIDMDLEVAAYHILPLINELEKGYDVVTGRRIYNIKLKVIVRWFLSKCYFFLVRLLLNTKLKDTETGCKFFNREKILPILDETKNTRWFWDTEIMIRSYLKKMKIKEFPVLYIHKPHVSSTVNVFKDSVDYIKNLIEFRRVLKKEKRLK